MLGVARPFFDIVLLSLADHPTIRMLFSHFLGRTPTWESLTPFEKQVAEHISPKKIDIRPAMAVYGLNLGAGLPKEIREGIQEQALKSRQLLQSLDMLL